MIIRRTAIILLALSFAVPAMAFGPATHIWIARQVTGQSHPALMYGATAPDMSEVADLVLGNAAMGSAFRQLTHYEYGRLSPSPFADGYATHNERCGADAYAHGHRDFDTDEWVEGYVIELADELSADTGADPTAAHGYIELALDMLMRREHGAGTGVQLLAASLLAGPGPTIDSVEAFSGEFADDADLSSIEASAVVALSDRAFRLALLVYGLQLVRPEAYTTRIVPVAFMVYDGVDYNTATFRLGRAIQLCEARFAELDDVPAFVEDGLSRDLLPSPAPADDSE
ncbi:MAG: hypothetical protein GY851_33215 [bacterium]|nr:hypothetical protein [bacterium]